MLRGGGQYRSGGGDDDDDDDPLVSDAATTPDGATTTLDYATEDDDDDAEMFDDTDDVIQRYGLQCGPAMDAYNKRLITQRLFPPQQPARQPRSPGRQAPRSSVASSSPAAVSSLSTSAKVAAAPPSTAGRTRKAAARGADSTAFSRTLQRERSKVAERAAVSRSRKRAYAETGPASVKRVNGTDVETRPVASTDAPLAPQDVLDHHGPPSSTPVAPTRKIATRALGGPSGLAYMTLRTTAEAHCKRLADHAAASTTDQVARNLLEMSKILVFQAVDQAERQRRIWVHQTMTGGPMWAVAGSGAGGGPSIVDAVPAVVQDRTYTPEAMFMPSRAPSRRAPGPLMYQ